MFWANELNLNRYDCYAAYSQRNWMGVERPIAKHDRVRLLSGLLHSGK